MPRSICRPCAAVAALLALLLAGCGDSDPTSPETDFPADGIEEPALDPDATGAATADPTVSEAAATRVPRSFFINPKTGSDSNAGTSLKPFKTLARGLSTAIAGDTMRLAVGVYSTATNGEKFTTSTRQVSVPAGVKIFGTLTGDNGKSQLQAAATDLVGLDLKGAATIRNVEISGFLVGIQASQGVQSLKNVALLQNLHGLLLGGTAKSTLTNAHVFVPSKSNVPTDGAQVFAQAQLIMDGGDIGGLAQTCNFNQQGINLAGAGRLTMRNNARIEDLTGPGIVLIGTSKASLSGHASINRNLTALGDCHPGPGISMDDSSTVTLTKSSVATQGGSGSVGIFSLGTGLLTLDSAVVVNHTEAGVEMLEGAGRLTAKGTLFQGNDIGIEAMTLAAAEVNVTGSTFIENTVGIRSPYLKLRTTKLSGNGIGAVLTKSTRFSDLGQTFDPGKNVFLNNEQTGVAFGPDVVSSGFGAVFASGNTWTALVQQADADGRYPTQPVVTSDAPNARGKNFTMPQAPGLFEIQL